MFEFHQIFERFRDLKKPDYFKKIFDSLIHMKYNFFRFSLSKELVKNIYFIQLYVLCSFILGPDFLKLFKQLSHLIPL